MIKLVRRIFLAFILLFMAPLGVHAVIYSQNTWPNSWRDANWSSSGTLQPAIQNQEAMIRIYTARTGRWKGIFAVHSWIVLKAKSNTRYDRYDVVGWGQPVRKNNYPADGFWYSSTPELQFELVGDRAQSLIPKIERAIQKYPYNQYGGYKLWPGPNSNSFIAHILRQVPELETTLPPTAVGKDFLSWSDWLSPTPSNTGWQISANGYVGVSLAIVEGFEINVLGLVAGIDFLHPALKLPGFGRIGVSRPLALPHVEP